MGLFNNREKKLITELHQKSESHLKEISKEIDDLLEDLTTDYNENQEVVSEFSHFVEELQTKLSPEDAKKLLEQTEDLYIDTIEYSEYEELLKQSKELKQEKDNLEDKVYHSTRLSEQLRIENEDLSQKLEVAKKALEFYGDDGPGLRCECFEEVGDGPMSGYVS